MSELRKVTNKGAKLAPKAPAKGKKAEPVVVKAEKIPVDPVNPFSTLSKFADELAVMGEDITPKEFGPDGYKTSYYSIPVKMQPVFDIVGTNKFSLELTNFNKENTPMKYQIKVTVDSIVDLNLCDETYLNELKRCLPLLRLEHDPTLVNPYLDTEYREFKMVIRNYWADEVRGRTKPVLKDMKNAPISPEDIKQEDRVRIRIACDSVSIYATREGEPCAKFGMTIRSIHKLPPILSPDMEASSPVEEYVATSALLKRKKMPKEGETPKKRGKKAKDSQEHEEEEETQLDAATKEAQSNGDAEEGEAGESEE